MERTGTRLSGVGRAERRGGGTSVSIRRATPTRLHARRFAPGLVSTDAIELNGVFSPDLREFYFTRVVDGVDTMHQIILADGRWRSPRELLLLPNRARAEAADMVLSRDGQELFFLCRFCE